MTDWVLDHDLVYYPLVAMLPVVGMILGVLIGYGIAKMMGIA